jgi:hypothetical protein
MSSGGGDVRDVVTALRTSQIVVDVAQAVNRARCRRVIDALGNCRPTDVFIRLPETPRQVSADDVLLGLLGAMPGATTVRWSLPARALEHHHGRPRYDGALVAYAATMAPGEHRPVSDVRRDLTMSATSWDRLASQLRDPASALTASLASEGARYVLLPRGKRVLAYIAKGDKADRLASG